MAATHRRTILLSYTLDVRPRGGASFALALASLGGLVVTMALALANEYWAAFPGVLLGQPMMVLAHGVLDALVVVPCCWLAVRADAGLDRV